MFRGDVLAGTIGIAKPVEHDFSPEEVDLLLAIGRIFAERLSS